MSKVTERLVEGCSSCPFAWLDDGCLPTCVLSTDLHGVSDDVDARQEVRRKLDALDLARESIAKLSMDFGKQSIVEGERWHADPHWFMYQCGKSRQCGLASVVLGALGNSIAAREAGNA